ncbi:MAG: hypothetical protein Q3M30_07925 [Candidatus Electrothrix sp. Rat3]|nr:hypothetical protein [Candidatus Electrothrix rattekaaiensis]
MARQIFFFLLCGLICCMAFPSLSLPEWHKVEIGFNLSYPDRVPQKKLALKKINQIGVHHVRIFEIFYGSITYQKRLKTALDLIVENGMIPMLSISNVPAELIPGKKKREENTILLPAKVKKRIAKTLLYSNRFPPNDLQQYKKKIQSLLDFLFHNYGREQVVQWWFEIGNEPDAPMYFWGTPRQFEQISKAAAEVLKMNGILHIGGYGVTHHAIFPVEYLDSRSRAYREIMRNSFSTANDKKLFISFHLYDRDKLSNYSDPLEKFPTWIRESQRQLIISEWNVSSQARKAKKIFTSPGAWGKFFLQLLISCHRNKVDRVYLFKLMDSNIFSSTQLGAFDIHGRPKGWYLEFIAIWKAIHRGYQINVLSSHAVLILGKEGESIIVAGKKPITMDIKYDLSYSPLGGNKGQSSSRETTVQAGMWAILKQNKKK